MSQLRVNTYTILDRAVEEGIAYGWRRAHKHDDKPDEFAIQEHIHDEVMNAVCEVFIFDHSDEAQEGDYDALRSQSEDGESGGEEGEGESADLSNTSGEEDAARRSGRGGESE